MATKKNLCTGCKQRFPVEDLKVTPAGKFHSHQCMMDYAYGNKDKLVKAGKNIKAKKEKEEKRKLKKRKDELRPIKWYEDRAQTVFNKFIRLRDKEIPCISCGKPDNGLHQRHASHYRSRGGCSYLRFDESNVHASCSQCNKWQSGNIAGYTPELILKVGQAEFERIKSSPKSYRWSRDELIEIHEKYKGKCRELETESA